MDNSILNDIKQLLGIQPEYTPFDLNIVTYVNTVFAHLYQIGVGPNKMFSVTDESQTWRDFLGDREDLIGVKTYMSLKVGLIFDPPANSFAIEAQKEVIKENEFRLIYQSKEVIQ